MTKFANVMGHEKMPLNLWGRSTLLLQLLYRDAQLPDCHIYGKDDSLGYWINGIYAGETEEEVSTVIWLMVESYAAEGHIDFQDNATVAESCEAALAG